MSDVNRRGFVKKGLLGVAAIPFCTGVSSPASAFFVPGALDSDANETSKIRESESSKPSKEAYRSASGATFDPNSPEALKVHYTPDVNKVSPDHPGYGKARTCSGCGFFDGYEPYVSRKLEGGSGLCHRHLGKRVERTGWCVLLV